RTLTSISIMAYLPFRAYLSSPHLYSLSLHDALPISCRTGTDRGDSGFGSRRQGSRSGSCRGLERIERTGSRHGRRSRRRWREPVDRKSTRLNSSHVSISYAVFCLKKKTQRD